MQRRGTHRGRLRGVRRLHHRQPARRSGCGVRITPKQPRRNRSVARMMRQDAIEAGGELQRGAARESVAPPGQLKGDGRARGQPRGRLGRRASHRLHVERHPTTRLTGLSDGQLEQNGAGKDRRCRPSGHWQRQPSCRTIAHTCQALQTPSGWWGRSYQNEGRMQRNVVPPVDVARSARHCQCRHW
jgi:hypothetical protein